MRPGIDQKAEILKLKNGSVEYDKAIDDVLNLMNKMYSTCRVVHSKTGLSFNGYDSNFPKGKNSLSTNSSKSFLSFGKTDEEIFEQAFGGHITEKDDGKKYVWNKIVYEGSEINKLLSNYYSDTSYIPLNDFSVERK